MKSQNFEFLRGKHSTLADLAGFAEHYAHSDPTSSLIKQRSFVEQAVQAVAGEAGVPFFSVAGSDFLGACIHGSVCWVNVLAVIYVSLLGTQPPYCKTVMTLHSRLSP